MEPPTNPLPESASPSPSPTNRRSGRELRTTFESLYVELRRVAGRIAGGGRWPTGTPTELVSEAVLKVLESDSLEGASEEDLRRMVPQIMRRVLIDRARKRGASKREALGRAVSEDGLINELEARSLEVGATDLVDLNEALVALEEVRPITAEFIAARFFAGLSVDDAAKVVGIGSVKAALYWSEGLKFLQQRFGVLDALGSAQKRECDPGPD